MKSSLVCVFLGFFMSGHNNVLSKKKSEKNRVCFDFQAAVHIMTKLKIEHTVPKDTTCLVCLDIICPDINFDF